MKNILFFCMVCLVSGCSSEIAAPNESDSLDEFGLFEKPKTEDDFNKAMLELNFFLDDYLLKPAAKVYKALVPEILQTGIGNFTNHLKIPFYVVNDLLQGDFRHASENIWVFSFNTLAGAGLFNASGYVDLTATPNDMGKTLHKWGVGSGPFLILPVIGPTYLRDFVGSGIGIFTDPVNTTLMYKEYVKTYYGLTLVDKIHQRSGMFETIEFLRNSYDPYSTLKSVYEQKRAAEIGGSSNMYQWIKVVLVVCVGIVDISASSKVNGAMAFIEKLTREGITVWGSKNEAEQLSKLKEVMNKDFDIPYIASRTAPQELWQYADQAQKDRYSVAFHKMLLHRYSKQFNQYKGQTFFVTKAGIDRRPVMPKPAGELYSVSTSVKQSDQNTIAVEWKVAYNNEKYTVIDVYIGGVSMVDVQANDFNGFVKDQTRVKKAFESCNKMPDVRKCMRIKLLDDLIMQIAQQ